MTETTDRSDPECLLTATAVQSEVDLLLAAGMTRRMVAVGLLVIGAKLLAADIGPERAGWFLGRMAERMEVA